MSIDLSGAFRSLKGESIWNPKTNTYVPIQPGTVAPHEATVLSGGPTSNTTEARLTYINVLVKNGIITAQEGNEARDRVLKGL
jgi:hypothetical protein